VDHRLPHCVWVHTAAERVLGFHIILAVSTYGGVLYLVSERSLPGDIPTREWIRGGIWVAGGLFLFGVFLLVVT
jgi:hypothetical protein